MQGYQRQPFDGHLQHRAFHIPQWFHSSAFGEFLYNVAWYHCLAHSTAAALCKWHSLSWNIEVDTHRHVSITRLISNIAHNHDYSLIFRTQYEVYSQYIFETASISWTQARTYTHGNFASSILAGSFDIGSSFCHRLVTTNIGSEKNVVRV